MQQIPPLALTFNFTYTTPKAPFLNKIENVITAGWQIGGLHALPERPVSDSSRQPQANFLTSEDTRVPGQPLYNVDVNNIHSYNPAITQLLNPAAWAARAFRNFRIKERMNSQIRAEFVNIFNRTLRPNPIATNPQNAVTKTAGINSSGFGVINTFATAGSQPTAAVPPKLSGLTGTLIARFTF